MKPSHPVDLALVFRDQQLIPRSFSFFLCGQLTVHNCPLLSRVFVTLLSGAWYCSKGISCLQKHRSPRSPASAGPLTLSSHSDPQFPLWVLIYRALGSASQLLGGSAMCYFDNCSWTYFLSSVYGPHYFSLIFISNLLGLVISCIAIDKLKQLPPRFLAWILNNSCKILSLLLRIMLLPHGSKVGVHSLKI